MTLLLKTDLEHKVNQKVNGRIARVGGTVNQLLLYSNCTVDDLNVTDEGFSSGSALFKMRRYLKEEVRFLRKGWKIPRARKTMILDMHQAYKQELLFSKYDAIVSSNVIEHSPNPIWLLLNFHFLTKPNGYQYHAIPHYKYIYDMYRKPTPVEHMVQDFEKLTNEADMVHNEDFIQLVIEKDSNRKEFHEKYPVAYPYIHFHVFDETNTRELFEFMFEDVESDVLKSEEFGDNLVLCRNTLRPDFVKNFSGLIGKYLREGHALLNGNRC